MQLPYNDLICCICLFTAFKIKRKTYGTFRSQKSAVSSHWTEDMGIWEKDLNRLGSELSAFAQCKARGRVTSAWGEQTMHLTGGVFFVFFVEGDGWFPRCFPSLFKCLFRFFKKDIHAGYARRAPSGEFIGTQQVACPSAMHQAICMCLVVEMEH